VTCYLILDTQKENAIALKDGVHFIMKAECDVDISSAEAYAGNWLIKTNKYFHCSAESDGGIDHTENNETTRDIHPQELVFDGKEFVGVYFEAANDVLFFSDGENASVGYCIPEHFVGGWGTVSEKYTYSLVKKA